MDAVATYAEIMKDSIVRNQAIDAIIQKIGDISRKTINSKTETSIRNILQKYEVEDGLSIFLASSQPSDKEFLAKVDTGKEYMYLWWGENRGKNLTSHSNRYAMGITFVGKRHDEISEYTVEDLTEEFSDFANIFLGLRKGEILRLYVYSKPGTLYNDVYLKHGKWLLRMPYERVASQSIGKLVGDSDYYIFQEGKTIRGNRYKKTIKIID